MLDVSTGYLQGVRCFFSIDLVGSTGLKSIPEMLPTKETFADSSRLDWVEVHLEFYEICINTLIHDPNSGPGSSPWDSNQALHFWRIRGDEVLLYSGRVREYDQVFYLLRTFCLAVASIDAAVRKRHPSLGARGVMWAAGFPIRNREILLSRHSPHIRPLNIRHEDVPNLQEHVSSAPFYDFGQNRSLEFIGPEIDLGFMLSSLTNPARVVTSLDVANIVAGVGGSEKHSLHFHHVGWQPLKGLYSGVPYPIIWADVRDTTQPKPRVSYEEALSPFSSRFFEERSEIDGRKIKNLCDSYLEDTKGFGRILMYLTGDKAPNIDLKVWGK